MNAIICARCGCPECIEGDTFCFNCGAHLTNYCTDENCPNSTAGLPLNYCYCPMCGSETELMQIREIEPRKFD